MTIFRVSHNKNYTCINNTICKDNRLSWKAKGIWLYAFSRPDDWKFHINDLINQSTDGRDGVRAGLSELEKAGYLVKGQKRAEDGKFGNPDWTFHEIPVQNIDTEAEKPSTAKPSTANHPLLSTDPLPSTDLRENNVATAPACSAEAERLSSLLLEKIKETKPDIKLPKLIVWTVAIDRMISIDHRDPSRIEEVLKWLPTSEFWRKNILSGDKLRKQFDQLELAMQPGMKNHRTENIKFYNDLIDSDPGTREAMKHLIIRGNFIYNREKDDGRELDLRMKPEAFIPALLAFGELRYV